MPAAFGFQQYKITDFHWNYDDSQEKSPGEQKVNLEVSLDRNDQDQDAFRLCLKIKVIGNPSVELIIHGFFKWKLEYTKGETEYCLITSGSSILYPYARAAVSSLSVLCGEVPIVLQTINFYELVEEGKNASNASDVPVE